VEATILPEMASYYKMGNRGGEGNDEPEDGKVAKRVGVGYSMKRARGSRESAKGDRKQEGMNRSVKGKWSRTRYNSIPLGKTVGQKI